MSLADIDEDIIILFKYFQSNDYHFKSSNWQNKIHYCFADMFIFKLDISTYLFSCNLPELNSEISTLTEVKQCFQKVTEEVLRKRPPKFCFLGKKRLEAVLTFTEDFWNKCSTTVPA